MLALPVPALVQVLELMLTKLIVALLVRGTFRVYGLLLVLIEG